jgi:molybdate transport system regulatory protein
MGNIAAFPDGLAMTTRATLRLDFDQTRRLGPGKIALLEAIERTGSISAAGREFGMAYRRAWLLTDEVNHMFARPLVTARGGGRNGGGATLTELGQKVVRLYRNAEDKVRVSASREIRAIEKALAP